MFDVFIKKLESIISIPPTIENETIIRQLTHRLINELRIFDEYGQNNEIESIIRQCCCHIERLNRNIITEQNTNRFCFAGTDISYALGNCVIACDTLLAKSSNVLTFQSHGKIECVCCCKLLIKAVTLIIEIFLNGCQNSFIEFKCRKTDRATILLAESDNNNQAVFNTDQAMENIRLLTKIANLHKGACISSSNSLGAYIAISISNDLKSENRPFKPPNYIDLLMDKFSDIYIGLSNIDEIHFRD